MIGSTTIGTRSMMMAVSRGLVMASMISAPVSITELRRATDRLRPTTD